MITVLFLQTRLEMGGAEMMWFQTIRRLDPKKFRPLLCCFYEPGLLGKKLCESGIQVSSFKMVCPWDPTVAFRLAKLLRNERVDILVMIDQPLIQFWGTLAGRWIQVPVLIISIHSTGRMNRVQRRFFVNSLTLGWVDRVIALSQTHKNYLVTKEGIDPKKIDIIPNGIEIEKFTAPFEKKELRKRFQVPQESGAVVGITAMLRPEKDHETFLKSAQAILRRMPSIHFLIVGDGPERNRLETLSATLGLSEHVHFLGLVEDMPSVVASFDIGVLSSLPVVETFPVSILEYMAAGKPVVATRVGSISEIVEEGKTGFLVDSGDWRGMAERITQLIEKDDLRHQMGFSGKQKVSREFTALQTLKKTEELFENLLKEKKG